MAISSISNDSKSLFNAYYKNTYKNEKEINTVKKTDSNTKSDVTKDYVTSVQSNEKSQVTGYSNLDEFEKYLSKNYESVRNGTVTISNSYLRECFNDDEKRTQLEKTLSNVENMAKDNEENLKGYTGMKVEINADGEIETETYGGAVIFNIAKRAAQIAAAMTSTDINMVMSILNKDLSDCESGLKNGFCDEEEVKKVKAMIQKAQAKQLELATQEKRDKAKGKEIPDYLTLNLLI